MKSCPGTYRTNGGQFLKHRSRGQQPSSCRSARSSARYRSDSRDGRDGGKHGSTACARHSRAAAPAPSVPAAKRRGRARLLHSQEVFATASRQSPVSALQPNTQGGVLHCSDCSTPDPARRALSRERCSGRNQLGQREAAAPNVFGPVLTPQTTGHSRCSSIFLRSGDLAALMSSSQTESTVA